MIVYNRRHPIHRCVRQMLYWVYNQGKKLYWYLWRPETIGVKCMVFNSAGQLLLVRVGYMHKSWVIPGGKVESGESFAEAAKRELYEEVGVAVEAVSPLFTREHTKQYKKDIVHYFKAISDVADFTIDDEKIIDVGWFSLSALPEPRTWRLDEALVQYTTVIKTYESE